MVIACYCNDIKSYRQVLFIVFRCISVNYIRWFIYLFQYIEPNISSFEHMSPAVLSRRQIFRRQNWCDVRDDDDSDDQELWLSASFVAQWMLFLVDSYSINTDNIIGHDWPKNIITSFGQWRSLTHLDTFGWFFPWHMLKYLQQTALNIWKSSRSSLGWFSRNPIDCSDLLVVSVRPFKESASPISPATPSRDSVLYGNRMRRQNLMSGMR